MRAVRLSTYSASHEGLECVEIDEPPAPEAGEVTIEIDASPIHPADLLSLSGRYAAPPPLPFIPGGEASARIIAVGPGVTGLAAGQRVIPLSRGNWTQRRTVAASDVIAVPDGDPLQLAMLKVVPATAHLMLTRIVPLARGDGVIQNAANSSVGLAAGRLAARMGLTMINVVRREELIDELIGYGAANAFLDGPDLPDRIASAFGEVPVRLAIDAVAGEASLRLSECLARDGTMVSYGLLSGEPCMVRPSRTIFDGIRLTGFWVSRHIANAPRAELEALYGELAALVLDGTIATPIEAAYPLEDVREAVRHAAGFRRRGKIMLIARGSSA
jgi:NADPH:quinone reductase-like Zn-dependent oxidoreductase